MGLKKSCIFEESTAEVFGSADSLEAIVERSFQIREVVNRGIGQGGIIRIVPKGLQGIELGGIGRQPFNPQPRLVSSEDLGGESASMSRQSIPEQDHFAAAMPSQLLEELDDLKAADASGMEFEPPIPASSFGWLGPQRDQPLSGAQKTPGTDLRQKAGEDQEHARKSKRRVHGRACEGGLKFCSGWKRK